MDIANGDPYEFRPDLSTFEKQLGVYVRQGHVGYVFRHRQVFDEDPSVELLCRLYQVAHESRWKELLLWGVLVWSVECAVLLAVLGIFVGVLYGSYVLSSRIFGQ